MTDQLLVNLGPVVATLAILIPTTKQLLKNQSDANNRQMQAQAELNVSIIERIDRIVSGIPEGNARIESTVTNQITASEGRINGNIHNMHEQFLGQLQRHAETCSRHLGMTAQVHEDASKRHDDDMRANAAAVTANAKKGTNGA